MTSLISVRQARFKKGSAKHEKRKKLAISWGLLFEHIHNLWQIWSRQISLVRWVIAGSPRSTVSVYINFYCSTWWLCYMSWWGLLFDTLFDKARKHDSAGQKWQKQNIPGKLLYRLRRKIEFKQWLGLRFWGRSGVSRSHSFDSEISLYLCWK